MAGGAGFALKALQWFVRAIQFCCGAIVLGIFSYFLATLRNHNLGISTWVRAVEGISGAAVLYTLIGLLLLCCLAGFPLTSFIAIVLDILFIGGFIYIAWSNRGGASSCNGIVSTPYGTGNADTNVIDNNPGGFTDLPSLHTACRLQTACLAVSIVAIFFFVISAILEVLLARHRQKEKRFGPSPANNYTSGYGKRRWFQFGRRGRRDATLSRDPNALPEHTHPTEVRDSYATEQTRVGTAQGADHAGATAAPWPKYGEAGYDRGVTNGTHGTNVGNLGHAEAGYDRGVSDGTYGAHAGHGVNMGTADGVPTAQYPEGNYRYDDGVYDPRP